MKRKTAPAGYASTSSHAAPAVVRAPLHPSQALASAMVRWMARGDTPPSLVLSKGLILARSPVNDGFPVEHVRAGERAAEGDNRVVMALLDRLKVPNVDKVAVIAGVLREVWVDKRAVQKPKSKPAVKAHPVTKRAPVVKTTKVPVPVVVVRRKVLEPSV